MQRKRREYKAAEKSSKRAIMRAEKELEKERDKDCDNKTLCVIRGHKVRHLMRTKEVVLGRATREIPVDINLAEEGPAEKVSRRHAIIKLKHDGEFYIKNIGRRALYVNGRAVMPTEKRKLTDLSLIDICDLRFIFEINKTLHNKVKKQLLQQQQQQQQQQAIAAASAPVTLSATSATTKPFSPSSTNSPMPPTVMLPNVVIDIPLVSSVMPAIVQTPV